MHKAQMTSSCIATDQEVGGFPARLVASFVALGEWPTSLFSQRRMDCDCNVSVKARLLVATALHDLAVVAAFQNMIGVAIRYLDTSFSGLQHLQHVACPAYKSVGLTGVIGCSNLNF